MPNWCTNHLEVTGPATALLDFAARATGADPLAESLRTSARAIVAPSPGHAAAPSDHLVDEVHGALLAGHLDQLSFTHHVPEPAEFPSSPNPFPDWYAWRLEHWGCKWDAAHPEVRAASFGTQPAVVWSFDTPWSPPLAWLDAVTAAHPDLRFALSSHEEGDGWLFHLVSGPHGEYTSWEGEVGLPDDEDHFASRLPAAVLVHADTPGPA